MPPELEWFANLGSKATRRAYEHALGDFMRFAGLVRPEEFRSITRSHVIAWRDDLLRRSLSGMTSAAPPPPRPPHAPAAPGRAL